MGVVALAVSPLGAQTDAVMEKPEGKKAEMRKRATTFKNWLRSSTRLGKEMSKGAWSSKRRAMG